MDLIAEWSERYTKLFDEFWKFLKKINQTYCFDCGKKLTKENIVLSCDSRGMLMFCDECHWYKIKVRNTWRKIFKKRGEGLDI